MKRFGEATGTKPGLDFFITAVTNFIDSRIDESHGFPEKDILQWLGLRDDKENIKRVYKEFFKEHRYPIAGQYYWFTGVMPDEALIQEAYVWLKKNNHPGCMARLQEWSGIQPAGFSPKFVLNSIVEECEDFLETRDFDGNLLAYEFASLLERGVFPKDRETTNTMCDYFPRDPEGLKIIEEASGIPADISYLEAYFDSYYENWRHEENPDDYHEYDSEWNIQGFFEVYGLKGFNAYISKFKSKLEQLDKNSPEHEKGTKFIEYFENYLYYMYMD
ncbi:MAG: hypothetical protein ACFFCS_25190 [Candidatus Hodarchaeota archaeon]